MGINNSGSSSYNDFVSGLTSNFPFLKTKTPYIKGADGFKLDSTGGFTPVEPISYDTTQNFKVDSLAGSVLKQNMFEPVQVPQIGTGASNFLNETAGDPWAVKDTANKLDIYRGVDRAISPTGSSFTMPTYGEYAQNQAVIGDTLGNQLKVANLGTAEATNRALDAYTNKQTPVLAGLNASELWGTGLQLGGLAMSYLNQKDNLALAKEANRQVQQNFDLTATEAGYETDPITGKKSTFKTRANRLASNALK